MVGRSAAKVGANMLYGLFGYSNFRYYERKKAEATAKGARDVLHSVMSILDGMGIETIYGDTDSDFFKADGMSDEQLNSVVEYINHKVSPYEVKLEHRFSQLVMFRKNSGEPAKKRYIGVEADGSLLARGVELRRGDWCQLAKDNLRECVMAVFNGVSSDDIRKHMGLVKKDLFTGKMDDLLLIRKGLKDDKKYKVKTPQMTAYTKGLKKGLYTGKEVEVQYYFDVNGEPEPWVDGKKSFSYADYYERQLYPPVNRLLMSIRVEKGKQITLA
jgi:DNA polymerase I